MGMWKDGDIAREQMLALATMLEKGKSTPSSIQYIDFEDVAKAAVHP